MAHSHTGWYAEWKKWHRWSKRGNQPSWVASANHRLEVDSIAPLLEIKQLTVASKQALRLKEINLKLEQGGIVGLLGPNGSGKSTLLQTCAGLQRPTSGSVLLSGQEVKGLSSKDRARQLAYMQQHTTPHPFSVQETVEMARYAYTSNFLSRKETKHEITDGVLKSTQIEHLRERAFNTLSGGEQQRVVFARTLAQNTPLLLLDEPTASMDLRHLTISMQNLQRLANQGRLVIMALHNLEQAMQYCNHLLLLCKGELVATGSVEEVLTPQNLANVFGINAQIHTDSVSGQPRLWLRGLS